MENNKQNRMAYLSATIDKYMKTPPQLTAKDVAEVIVFQVGDIRTLLKEIAKEVKKI